MSKIRRNIVMAAALMLGTPVLSAVAAVPAQAQDLPPGPAVGTDHNGNEYAFWENQNQGLEQSTFDNGTKKWSTPAPVLVDGKGMGPLTSPPAVAVNYQNGYRYVFWVGTDNDVWETYYNQNGWHAPAKVTDGVFHNPMGPVESGTDPTAGIDSNGYEYVMWENAGGGLEWTVWDGVEFVPQMAVAHSAPMGSEPSVAPSWGGAEQVAVWEGTDSQLWTVYNTNAGASESWETAPQEVTDINGKGMGPLGSQPAACTDNTLTPTTWAVWSNTNQNLELTTSVSDSLYASAKSLGMGPLNSAPSISCGASERVFWRGTNGDIWEAYNNGSKWFGPDDQGISMNEQ
jgi:hypothetical protein